MRPSEIIELHREFRNVAVGGMLVCDSPHVVLQARSVGMGMAVAGFDPVTRVGGLFHSALPEAPENSSRTVSDHPAMFVAEALPALVAGLRQAGARRDQLVFFAAGGAELLEAPAALDVGRRNRQRLQEIMAEHGFTMAGTRLGGRSCRTVCLPIADGRAFVRLAGGRAEEVLCPQ